MTADEVPDPQVVTTIRLSKTLAEQVEMVARIDGQPISEEMREALVAHIEQRRKDPEFQERLRRSIEQNRAVLERLAQPEGTP